MSKIRHDWLEQEILEIYEIPLLDLVYKSATIHREFHNPSEVQVSCLLSIKTGACMEDCAYCPQSARYKTDIEIKPLMDVNEVVSIAKKAKISGATRFCMGASWRDVKDGEDFERVLEMVKAVDSLEMEVCCTLGMLTEKQAERLASVGLYAYNHNLDTSPEYYDKIITTRKYVDRLKTIKNVRKAGITVCCGGIIGMGESIRDRIRLLQVLSSFQPHPESVPINALVPVKGTPLENQNPTPSNEMIKMIATA
ncbi:MAG: biotin synthase BioB, partial [Nanoarchaeota archaeon]